MERPKCIIEGCNNNAMSKGIRGGFIKLCTSHHKKKYGMRRSSISQEEHGMSEWLYKLSKEPCIKCGWNLSYCDRHRILHGSKGGEYRKGNVVPLCPNCHRVEHEGILELNKKRSA